MKLLKLGVMVWVLTPIILALFTMIVMAITISSVF